MEDPEAVKVTTIHSYSPTEQSADEKHPADLTMPEGDVAAGISTQEEAEGRSPVVGVQFHSPTPAEGVEAGVLEANASRSALNAPSCSEDAGVRAFDAVYTEEESNKLQPIREGTEALVFSPSEEGFEPHSLPFSEFEQVPTFDALQAREETHRMSTEAVEVLGYGKSSLGVEHRAPMLLEGVESLVSEHIPPLGKDMEVSSLLLEKDMEASLVLPEKDMEAPSVLPEKDMEAPSVLSEKDIEAPFVLQEKDMEAPSVLPMKDMEAPSVLPEKDMEASSVLPEKDMGASSVLPGKDMESSSVFSEKEMEASSVLPEKDMKASSVLPGKDMEVSSVLPEKDIEASPLLPEKDMEASSVLLEKDMEASSVLLEKDLENSFVLPEKNMESSTVLPKKDMEASTVLAQCGVEAIDGGWKEENIDPDVARVVGSDEIDEYKSEMVGDLVEVVVNDVVEEAIESAGEDVEAACSGDIASENEFSMVVDMKRRGGKKRKRGRPSSKLQGTRFPSQKKYEEEVCFICFDGGDLVVCDRRGCPKVYHPSCVNREEDYFQSKGQWSCGWHLCSKCPKSASYKCYTCTYSLCKLCVNEEEFTCIRGIKGFCTACLTTILLMETSEKANVKKDGVDFNDRSCWEYLFKDYWYELKAELSMNLDELSHARSASKVSALGLGIGVSSDDAQDASSDRSSACHDESISSKKLKLGRNGTCKITRKAVHTEGLSPYDDNSSRRRAKNHYKNATPDSSRKEGKAEALSVHQESSLMIKEKKRLRKAASTEGTSNDTKTKLSVHKTKYSRKKLKRRSKGTVEENMLEDADKEQTTVVEYDWASRELLEFVSHVKNGDRSILSPYDVQELLLDYIKVNNLRNPRKKSEIICDRRLLKLFDKARLGHFEMLKLLESHFSTKVSSPASDKNHEGHTDPIEMGAEVSDDLSGMMITDKRKMFRKRVESEPQTNLYSYAAIDVHNINLMYLKRYLMEELLDDMSTFSEKVIGSFVRIRVTSSSQKQEVYRLVQVVGCGKAPEEYKTGKRTTDVMLEVINLDKKEVITVDIISNQEFTEEECKRLRQSIKFGFITRLTVGEVQEKARVLQSVRINDHLESEKLRLTNLRDRASEKGRRKEHRECVEKLQLLSSSQEHMKRLNEIAQAHSDPKMDPTYESPEDDGDEDEIKGGNPDRSMQSTFKERELISPKKEGSCNRSGVPQSLNNVDVSPKKTLEQNSNVEAQKIEAKFETLLDVKEPTRESAVLPEPVVEISPAKIVSQPNVSETEKIWHYKDPSGKIQGPFSLVQLRKWSKHFPSNLAIWKRSERQEDSILLTDALAGNFQKDLPEWVPQNSVNLSSSSPSIINSSKVLENTASVQNSKAANNAACIDSIASLNNKQTPGNNDLHRISRNEQVVAHVVNSESTHQGSYQLIDVHNRAPVISSDLDPRKKFFEEPCTTSGNGDNLQKHDKCSNHLVKAQPEKVADHSTSSTESNTVPEASQSDHTSTSFQKGGASEAKPVVESNALESSPQRSTSAFPKSGPETRQPAYANTSIQIPSSFVNSASGKPSHAMPQAAAPFPWNQPTNTNIGEQSVPSLNSTTMTSGVSALVNSQPSPLLSSDSTKPFSSPHLNNSTSTVTCQPPNMSWVNGTADANSGWQVQTQYQNPNNVAAASPNLLCGTGVQGVAGNNANLGWGMMAQGNMNMPWVAPPNANHAWNQGLPMPPQGNAPLNFTGPPPPPPQGNVAPYPVWGAPVQQMNSNQNPVWSAPPNAIQIAPPRDSSKEIPSSSNVQREKPGDRNFGHRDGGFRGSGPGYGPGRQPRNYMGPENGDRSSRPPPEYVSGICSFYRSGHCKKGAFCNYSHS